MERQVRGWWGGAEAVANRTCAPSVDSSYSTPASCCIGAVQASRDTKHPGFNVMCVCAHACISIHISCSSDKPYYTTEDDFELLTSFFQFFRY